MDWMVIGSAGLIYLAFLLLLGTDTGRGVLDRLNGFSGRRFSTTLQPGDVLYDGTRYYRTVSLNDGMVTVHFVLTVGEVSALGSGRMSDGRLRLNGRTFDVVKQGAEALEFQGEIPKDVVKDELKPRHDVAAPFQDSS